MSNGNTSTADNSQSNGIPSSSECENIDVKSPVAIATPSEAANHEARQLPVLQDHTVASDGVNLANIDHIQTVMTVQPPTTSYDYCLGLCPICGDRISGMYWCFVCLPHAGPDVQFSHVCTVVHYAVLEAIS